MQTSDPDADDEAALGAARAAAAAGRLDEARAALLELRARLARPSANLQMNLASVEHRRGDLDAAIAALEAAIAAEPTLGAAHKNLAALHAAAGRADEARRALERAVASIPADASLWTRLGRAQASLGDAPAALASADAAERAGPADARTWREIGLLRAECWRWDEAARALAEASRHDPGAVATETLHAVVKQEQGDIPGALRSLSLADSRHPGDLQVALAERLLLPQVYEDAADVARWRARYADGLARSVADLPRWRERAADVFELNRNNFLLAYQGEDDLALQRQYSSILASLAGTAHPEWREPRERTFDGGRRLRIGFVGGIFRDCTAGRYFERWVTGLDARRFERFVYHTSAIEDGFTERIAQGADRYAALRSGALDVAARLAGDALDVIVHPEVGMMPLSYLLAALRLAPVQVAGWGHPVTTGSDTIDHYVTCGAMEPPDAARHYAERLIMLPGPGVDYAMPEPPGPARREDFRLPPGGRVYTCAQSLFKIHPDMDALLAGVLEADPEGVLVLFQAPARAVTAQLASRLQRALAARGIAARGQVKFLPRMGGAAFRRALAASDVVLDTVRWSGGNTSLDAIAAGTPVVTLPGRFMRGRQTAAMLRMMGLEALVAASPAEYVRIALETARDRDRNAALRQAIARERAVLFDRPEPIAALAESLLAAAAKT
ncbi:MAG TPA: tetratricopeptide repeat protein [Usitatibacter sp.]|jgi:CRISPR-associated protein Csy1|nr:tetratricopeptide repeat protein [Usitatibacter sp.]